MIGFLLRFFVIFRNPEYIVYDFHKATSRLHFMQLLQATHTPNPPSRTTTAAPQPGDAVAVLRLDFARNILTQLL